MFNKINCFTLIELIVVIAVLGILTSIVLPNISNLNQKAQVSSISSNIRNVQTAVDAYKIDYGIYPTINQPTIESPQYINFEFLYPEYLKDIPQILKENYWVDSLGVVWASESNPVEIKKSGISELSWETVPNGNQYKLYEIINKDNNKKEKQLINTYTSHSSNVKSRKDLNIFDVKDTTQIVKVLIDPNKQYLVSASDSLGFFTAPIGLEHNTDTDISIPDGEVIRNLYINTMAYDTADWLSISKRETVYDGTSITYSFAYSNGGSEWSDWYENIEDVPNSKYLRIKITLTREENRKSPILHFLKVNYKVDGKTSECPINLFYTEESCKDVTPSYPEDTFIPNVPNINLPSGGNGSHEIKIPEGSIITDVVPDYDMNGTNTSNGGSDDTNSNKKPDVSFNVSYDNGNTWKGTYSHILDVPNKDKVTDLEVSYNVPNGSNTTIKPPYIIVTNKENQDSVDKEIETPNVTNWIVGEEFELIENPNEVVEWLNVDVKQTLPNSSKGILEVYLSTSDDDITWSEEILGTENIGKLSNSKKLKVKIISKYSDKYTIDEAPLLEEITITSKKSDGTEIDNSYSKNEEGNFVNSKPKIEFSNDFELIYENTPVVWEYKNNNPEVEILEEQWILNEITYDSSPNISLSAGSYHLELKVKTNFTNEWVSAFTKTFNVKPFSLEFYLGGGKRHSFVLTESGEVYAMGSNMLGQLGYQFPTQEKNEIQKVTYFNDISPIKEISVGGDHTLFLLMNGDVYSLGDNSSGELGLGHNNKVYSPQQISFFNDKKVKTIYAGKESSSFAILENGQVYSWGENNHGQLGLGSFNNANLPTLIKSIDGNEIQQIASDRHHSLFLFKNGSVQGCGHNYLGQLGMEGTWNRTTLVPIPIPEPVSKIEISSDSSFALTPNGDLYSWGWNIYGQLGIGNTTNKFTPVKNPYLKSITDVGAMDQATVVLDKNGNVYSFGFNNVQQLGLGIKDKFISIPRQMTFFNSIKVTNINNVGSGHIFVEDANSIYGWGEGFYGQLGFVPSGPTIETPMRLNNISNLK